MKEIYCCKEKYNGLEGSFGKKNNSRPNWHSEEYFHSSVPAKVADEITKNGLYLCLINRLSKTDIKIAMNDSKLGSHEVNMEQTTWRKTANLHGLVENVFLRKLSIGIGATL